MKKTNFGGLTKPSKSPYRTKRKYYAVRHGRNGFTGVLSSWDECEPLIKGVKGVSYKSFPSEEEAFAFARPEAAQQQPSSASGRQAKKKFYAIRQGQGGFRGVVSSWDECQLYVQGTPGVRYKSFKTYEEAFEFSQTVEEPNADPGSSVADAGGASHPTDSDPEFILRIDMAPVPFFPSPQQYSKLIVFTDGACQNNGKWNSRAGYGVFFGENSPYNISEPLRGHATNQRAEMTAVLAAIQTVLANDLVTRHGMLEVRTDSQYTKNGMEKWVAGWKKKKWKTVQGQDVKNKDLWVALDAAKLDLMKRTISFVLQWVKGHSGNPGNEAADRLAVAGIHQV